MLAYSRFYLSQLSTEEILQHLTPQGIIYHQKLYPDLPNLNKIEVFATPDSDEVETKIRNSNIVLAKSKGIYDKLLDSFGILHTDLNPTYSSLTDSEKEMLVFSSHISATKIPEIEKFFQVAPHLSAFGTRDASGNNMVNVGYLMCFDVDKGMITSEGVYWAAYEAFLKSQSPIDVQFKEYWEGQKATNGENYRFSDSYIKYPDLEDLELD